jgi:hypothetical protein
MEMGFNLPAEMLATYKIQILDKMRQGYDVADVPCELLVALIERAEAWMRLQADEALFDREKAAHEPTNMG